MTRSLTLLVFLVGGCAGSTSDSPPKTEDVDGDGYTTADGDCDDTDPDVSPGATEHFYDGVDSNCDGGADEYDQDGDGALQAVDCDDTDPTSHPGAEELCDSVDNDCDGATDDAPIDGITWYADVDGDGHGDADSTLGSCDSTAPDGYVAGDDDCDDTDGTVHPGATDSCGDGVDSDCSGSDATGDSVWYLDADHDSFGDDTVTATGCTPPSGYVAAGGDCDDTVETTNPGATETCDGLDNDCSGTADDHLTNARYYADADLDGYGDPDTFVFECAPPDGYVLNADDCDDSDATLNPDAHEVCDTIDNDCDGAVDDGVSVTYYVDNDADGYGNSKLGGHGCEVPEGTATEAGDCDDTDAAINPGASEACDDVDQDCDGVIDDHGGCFGDTGMAVQLYYGTAQTSGGSWVDGTFGVTWLGTGSGASLCTIVGEMTAMSSATGCPGCDWAFDLHVGTTSATGDQCDDLQADSFDFSRSTFEFGFASAYDLYGDGSLTTSTVLIYSSGYGWLPYWYEDAGTYPDAWNSVTGDASDVTFQRVVYDGDYASYPRYATWYTY